MSRLIVRVLLFSGLLGLGPGFAQDTFRPANFRGLTMGKSTVEDAIRLLGKPKDTFLNKVSGVTWLYYENIGPAPGKVEMVTQPKTTVISAVAIHAENLTEKAAKTIFGPAFKVTRYGTDECLSDGEGGPYFESKDGQWEFVVYPDKGIAIDNNVGHRGVVIFYLDQPLGPKQSRCLGKKARP